MRSGLFRQIVLAVASIVAVAGFIQGLLLGGGDLRVALAGGMAGEVGGAVAGALLAGRLCAALARLTRAVRAVAAGEAARTPAVPGDDELGELARAIDDMAGALRREAATAADQRDTLSAVLAAMADGVVVLDAGTRVRLSKPAATGMLAAGACTGRLFAEVAGEGALLAVAQRALRRERAEATVELAGGRVLRAAAAPLARRGEGAVLVLHDLSESRRLERARQQFVANASHELLTPVGTVGALVDALAEGALEDPETARRFLGHLRVETARLADLARDLLDLAQAQAGDLQLAIEPTDVGRVAETVLQRLRPRAAQAGVALELRADAAPPALADAARLEQVLLNLVHNALKFTPQGGRVTVGLALVADEVVLSVADSGVGIPPAELPRVFERFYKVRATATAGVAGGTGLGLAIARHLVQAMGGRIWAASELGGGSTFSIALPRAEAMGELSAGALGLPARDERDAACATAPAGRDVGAGTGR